MRLNQSAAAVAAGCCFIKGEQNGAYYKGHPLRETDMNQVPRGQECLDCEGTGFRVC